MYFAAAGVTTCFIATLLIVQFVDLPDQASKVDKCDSPRPPEKFDGAIELDETAGLAPTGTSTVPYFPKIVKLPHDGTPTSVSAALPAGTGEIGEEEYHLVGLGIRKVSFLQIQVYVVGFYVAKNDLAQLQSRFVKEAASVESASALVAGEKDKLRTELLDADKSEEVWNDILKDGNIRTLIRIVPTRNTDLSHLRDSWVRGITARSQAPFRAKQERFDDEGFGAAMGEFKKLFSAKKSIPKGNVVIFDRNAQGVLRGWIQKEEGDVTNLLKMGEVQDERISRLVWIGYLGGKSVASEAARRSIVDGVISIVERPIGTVETQVV